MEIIQHNLDARGSIVHSRRAKHHLDSESSHEQTDLASEQDIHELEKQQRSNVKVLQATSTQTIIETAKF